MCQNETVKFKKISHNFQEKISNVNLAFLNVLFQQGQDTPASQF